MRIAVWATKDQQLLLERAFQGDDLQCTVVGCADKAQAEALAEPLGADAVDDVRQLLQSDNVDALWLAAPRVLDAPLQELAGELNVPVATSAPFVEGFRPDLYGSHGVRFIPLLRGGPSWLAASGCLEMLGQVHCVQVSATAGDHQTSLHALLIDAADVITHLLLGMPDEVYAAQSGPPLSSDPGAEIRGHLTSTMRFPHGGTASITVSDGGGSWIRRATVLGDAGRVIITDEGVAWTDPDGAAQEAPPSESHATAGALSRWHLLRMGQDTPVVQPDADAALLCEALRLSCLTGQVEELAHVAHMFGR